MGKNIVRLKESDLEKLIQKIIKEDNQPNTQPRDGKPKEEKKTTITRHPAYPIIDKLERHLDDLKAEFKRDIANKVSGEDGYHSEIDKFTSDFNKFIGKVSDLKGKINDYEISTKDSKKKEYEQRKASFMAQHNQRKQQASQNGKNYSY